MVSKLPDLAPNLNWSKPPWHLARKKPKRKQPAVSVAPPWEQPLGERAVPENLTGRSGATGQSESQVFRIYISIHKVDGGRGGAILTHIYIPSSALLSPPPQSPAPSAYFGLDSCVASGSLRTRSGLSPIRRNEQANFRASKGTEARRRQKAALSGYVHSLPPVHACVHIPSQRRPNQTQRPQNASPINPFVSPGVLCPIGRCHFMHPITTSTGLARNPAPSVRPDWRSHARTSTSDCSLS